MRKFILLLLCTAAWAQQPVQLTDGTNYPAAVKGAQTPPVLADKALTVALSPNNTGMPVNQLSIVQKRASASSGSVASLALAYTSNVTAGNSLVVTFCNGNVNAPTGPISDTLALTWTKAVHQVQGSALECDQWYAVGAGGGADTITVTPGGTNASIAMEIYEISGLIQQIPAQADVIASSSGSSGTAATSAISPFGPNALLIADVGIGTAAQTITVSATCPSCFTNDSGQQNPATAAGLFSFVSMSVQLDDMQAITPSATFTSEPWAIAAAIYHAPVMPIGGVVQLTDGVNRMSLTGSSVNVNVTNTNVNGQATSANSAPVVIASDQSPLPTGASSNSAAAASACNILSAASTNSTNCKASAGNFYGFEIFNTTTTVYYLRLYNSSSAPTCSSATGFVRSIPIPPGGASGQAGGAVSNQFVPTNYSTGISYCITGGSSSTDNTNAATGVFGEIRYK